MGAPSTGLRQGNGTSPTEATYPDVGMVLLDPALKIIGLDRGAVAILNGGDCPGKRPPWGVSLPPAILDALRHGPCDQLPDLRASSGEEYACHAYLVEPQTTTGLKITALHLKKQHFRPQQDNVDALSFEYRLTEREHEALRGIAQGLTTKELARQMSISPNTVKAFLRLIMIKMGVSTRAGIVAKLLKSNGCVRSPYVEVALPSPPPNG